MPSHGWETAGPDPSGQKKLVTSDGAASAQLKRMTGGSYRDQLRIYGELPAGGWFAAVLTPDGRLLGHGSATTKKAAREAMLAAAGLTS